MSAHLKKLFSLQRFALWLPVVTMLLIEFVRLMLVSRFSDGDAAVSYAFVLSMALKHDAAIVGAVLLLQVIGFTAWRPVADAARLAAWGVLILSVIDLFVFAQFSRRLRLSDIFLYGSEGHAIGDIALGFFKDFRNAPLVVAGAGTLIGLTLFWVKPSRPRLQTGLATGAVSLFLIGCSTLPDPLSYNNAWTYKNIAEIHLMNGVIKPYTPEAVIAAKQWTESTQAATTCEPGLASRRNVTLVIWESLSSHHSAYLSGLSDWTPQFDALARKHHIWTNFYANGNNTAWGYVASLTGHDPLIAMNTRNFGRWHSLADALPSRIQGDGYTSAFMTPGDNSFLDVGNWMKSIGFDHVEGHEAPFYEGMERFNFRAAPDGALYERSRQWMKQEKKPFVLVLKTVSTHQPYMNPVTREQSEEAAFRYADEALGKYVRDLTHDGYFERGGVLMVTGDHRDMVALGPEEVKRFGRAADSMIPLLVIGKDLPIEREISTPYQQADITPSIEYLVSTKACFQPRQRNLFQANSAAKPRCILHMRSDEYDAVDAFCDDQYGKIQLDADNTKMTQGAVWNAPALINEINAERIGWFMRRKPDGTRVRELPRAFSG